MADLPNRERASFLECNCTVIRRASRHLSLLYDREFASLGLKTTQVVLLALVAGGDCSSIPELAEKLVMDRSTIGHNLRPLEREGLVELIPGDDDRRRRMIRLTDAGVKKLATAYEHWEVVQARFHDAFGMDDALQMRDMMMRVVGLSLDPRP